MRDAPFTGAAASGVPGSGGLLNAPHVRTTHALQPVRLAHANEGQLCTRGD